MALSNTTRRTWNRRGLWAALLVAGFAAAGGGWAVAAAMIAAGIAGRGSR